MGWAYLISGVIAGATDGTLTLFPYHSFTSGIQTASGPSSLLCLTSSASSSSTFALAGKEVDVSVRDVERTFGSSPAANADGIKSKNDLEAGEVWRAKNVGARRPRISAGSDHNRCP